MDKYLDAGYLTLLWERLQTWVAEQVLVPSSLIQLGALAFSLVAALALAPYLKKGITRLGARRGTDIWTTRAAASAAALSFPVLWLLFTWLSVLTANAFLWPHHIITIAVSLMTAWVVIHLVSAFIRNETLSKAVAIVAWTVAALNILNLLGDVIAVLDGAAISLGDVRISALALIKGVLALTILLWVATVVSALLERRIQQSQNLTPSVQVLFAKLLKIVLLAAAVVVALESVGVDLSAFTVFTGALGVGIGFGLQKIVANLISGVIILMDKSIKPGDVIEVGETYGWVNSLGSRYASVVTRDSIEYLIPNEELISTRVANWSFSRDEIRLKLPVGISYDSDPRKAQSLCVEAAAAIERILDDPAPVCLVKGFGDSSVDLELRIWINDPRNGVSNVKSLVYLEIWDRFHQHGIAIPYPQRDIHIKSPGNLAVTER